MMVVAYLIVMAYLAGFDPASWVWIFQRARNLGCSEHTTTLKVGEAPSEPGGASPARYGPAPRLIFLLTLARPDRPCQGGEAGNRLGEGELILLGFVPEEQHHSSQARSAWNHVENSPSQRDD